ncbi:MAG: ABC transporter substrate-binding protein [Chloroflexota bacterium]
MFRSVLLKALLVLLLVPSLAFAQEATEVELQETIMGQDMAEVCPTPQNLPETVTIGAVFGLSGPISVYGGPQQQAVQLAVDEVNATNYLGEGTTLEVIFEDSAGDAQQTIGAITKLVEQDQVTAIIGPTLSTEAVAGAPVAQEAGTPILGVSNTASGLRELIGDFYYRNSLPEQVVIPGTVAQAVELLGLERVGVLYGNDDDFTLSGYDVFVQALEDNGVEILGEETFARGDVDFSAQLTNLIGQNPDALVASALAAEATQIIVQARQLGYNGPIIGGNGFNSPAVIQNSGEDAEGLIVGGAWNIGNPNPSPSSVIFAANFEAVAGYPPDQFAAQAYSGAWQLATAIRCADSVDRVAVRDALGSIQNMETPLGTFSFDENGEPVHDPIAQIVQNGEFVPLALAVSEGE